MYKQWLENNTDHFYTLFRIAIGLLFFEHGAQKLFGWFGGTAQTAFALMWFVGLVEFLGGLGIATGVLTRLSAVGNVIIMGFAWFRAHFNAAEFPNGWIPIMNRGELALVYLACFLLIMAKGSGKDGLEKAIFKKELT